MKTYVVQYRIDGGAWVTLSHNVKARSPAGAISQFIKFMSDVSGALEISAV